MLTLKVNVLFALFGDLSDINRRDVESIDPYVPPGLTPVEHIQRSLSHVSPGWGVSFMTASEVADMLNDQEYPDDGWVKELYVVERSL